MTAGVESGGYAPVFDYCASVSPNLRCVSTIVRRRPDSVSGNVHRKRRSIARRAVHHCAPLPVWRSGFPGSWHGRRSWGPEQRNRKFDSAASQEPGQGRSSSAEQVRCGAVTSMQVGGDAITITITRFGTDRRGLLARVISGHLGHRPDIPRLRPDQTCLCRLFQRMRDPADDTARREDSRECIAWNQQRFQQ
jgi:hypothetical protein